MNVSVLKNCGSARAQTLSLSFFLSLSSSISLYFSLSPSLSLYLSLPPSLSLSLTCERRACENMQSACAIFSERNSFIFVGSCVECALVGKRVDDAVVQTLCT